MSGSGGPGRPGPPGEPARGPRGKKADDVVRRARENQRATQAHLREIADWFHQQEGRLIPREAALAGIEADLGLNAEIARRCISNLVSDIVDPVVQVPLEEGNHVGVIDFWPHDWWYRYVHYDDGAGQLMRGVCAVCVDEKEHDKDVVHATEGTGTIPLGADYSEIRTVLERHLIQEHGINSYTYEAGSGADEPPPTGRPLGSPTDSGAERGGSDGGSSGGAGAGDDPRPDGGTQVELPGIPELDLPDGPDMTGATLLSGSTVAGNSVFHAGNHGATDDHHTRYADEEAQDAVGNNVTNGLSYDDAAPSFGMDVVATGSVTLSSGSASIDTGVGSATTATFMVALGPSTDDADVAADIKAVSGGNYQVDVEETDTSVGNPTVEFDVVRVR